LAFPPILSKPLPGETLFLYLPVSDTAVSLALIREDEGIQKPVYYVSKALINAQTRYIRIEKLELALFVTVRNLKHYFQSFSIVMLIEYELRTIVEDPEASDRITKWVIEIRPLGITFEARTSIKGQILADFIVEFTPGPPPQYNSLKGWILNVDGASNSKGAGVGVVITTPDESIIEQSYTLGFRATNNEAEYEAVIAGLKMATTLGVAEFEVRCDSLLIACQINGEYAAKDDRMAAHLKVV